MGLAASQARLLTITARKADCEFQSMLLSHEKIALSRDMEKVSDEYQKAMNQTKLTYDYYGSGTSQMNLNYSLLMTPSVYNDYYPKLITDNKNRVVLSGDYAYAAQMAGIPAEGYNGTPSSEVRNKFIEALKDKNVITAATAATVESVSYNNVVGLGGTYSASQATQDITYNDLLDLIKENCTDTKDYGLKFPDTTIDTSDAYLDGNMLGTNDKKGRGGELDGRTGLWVGDTTSDRNKVTTVTLYDLLKKDAKQYNLELVSPHAANVPTGEAAYLQRLIVGTDTSSSFLNWMTDQFSSILGGVNSNDVALQYAYNQVYDLIYPNENIQEKYAEDFPTGYGNLDHDDVQDRTSKKGDRYSKQMEVLREAGKMVFNHGWQRDRDASVYNSASNYMGFVYNAASSGHTSDDCPRNYVSVNLNNLAQVFLTAYVEYQQGVDNSKYYYEKGSTKDGYHGSPKAILYEGDKDDVFTIAAGTETDSGDSDLYAQFYDALFNRICANGWTKNENITDADYMQNLLKGGAVFISSLDNDGYYYQSNYSSDTYISEVSDSEGVAQAEAKYNSEKAKIENKENTIDMKMKNLDTEISSLSTEYDTMKNVISKSIEKSFKRYDA